MVERGDRRQILLPPINGYIALGREETGEDAGVDCPHIMRAVIGPLLLPVGAEGIEKSRSSS
jgi:hypothetical protein